MSSSADGEPHVGLNAQRASSGSQVFVPGGRQRPRRQLLDRGDERARIDGLVDVVRRGFSAVLVLRGSPGAGKSALAGYAVESASGFRVSAVSGVESEISLPFGAVHQLLVPFLPLIDDLPVPQGRALRVAFGLEAARASMLTRPRRPRKPLS